MQHKGGSGTVIIPPLHIACARARRPRTGGDGAKGGADFLPRQRSAAHRARRNQGSEGDHRRLGDGHARRGVTSHVPWAAHPCAQAQERPGTSSR